MQDNIGIVIAMILIVTLIIIFPIYNLFERQDDMTYTLALKATTNFVDKVKNNGYIDQQMYDEYVIELSSTGISYDIELEAHRKKLVEDGNKSKYFVQYKIDYNDDIFKEIENKASSSTALVKNGAYLLNNEDQIFVKLRNSNQTASQVVLNAIIPTKDKNRIEVNYGGIIKNNSWEKVDSTVYAFSTNPSIPIITKANGENVSHEEEVRIENGETVTFRAKSTPSDWFKNVKNYTWQFTYPNGAKEEKIIDADSNQQSSLTKVYKNTNNNIPIIVNVYATDTYGEDSLVALFYIKTYDVIPTTPTLISNPDTINNNIVVPMPGGTEITFKASSSITSRWKSIKHYVYEITNGANKKNIIDEDGIITHKFRPGSATVTVYAVDTDGKKSPTTGTAFFLMENFKDQAITGTGLAQLESIPIENTVIVGYTFKVKIRPGHSGNDWWKVIGVKEDGTQEVVAGTSTRNGISTEGDISADKKYSYLIFQYSVQSGHSHCLNENPTISYTVDYKFIN